LGETVKAGCPILLFLFSLQFEDHHGPDRKVWNIKKSKELVYTQAFGLTTFFFRIIGVGRKAGGASNRDQLVALVPGVSVLPVVCKITVGVLGQRLAA
jgi:hypothetical protein